ncbi:hypothetical protein TNCV_4354011 [Trichonephila clavipes]|nr:hypothetical protein TNCV_4354011 [Trichonephila clavipes]
MPQRLNGAKYLFLQHILPELLQRISVNAHQNVSFMYNGALAHFLWQCVTTYMLHITGGGLDPTDLLLCSTLPEPQSLDFFLGNLKSLVIRPWRLQWRISWHGSSSLQLTSPTPELLERVRQSFVCRRRLCYDFRGHNFEKFL